MKQNTILFSVAAVVLILAGAGCSQTAKPAPVLPKADPLVAPTSTPSTTTPAAPVVKPLVKPKIVVGKAVAPSAPATKGYLELLEIYKNSGYYYQFVDCHALPGVLSLKKGVTFMLDNRDIKSRVIKVDQTTYNLGAYGYAIAKVPAATGAYYITCDGGGSAQLNVQP